MSNPAIRVAFDCKTLDRLEAFAQDRNITMGAVVRNAVIRFLNEAISKENGTHEQHAK